MVSACADDPPFQSLDTLCEALTDDLCDARGNGCCTSLDRAACVDAELARCEQMLTGLTAEPLLRYDARDAEDKRRAARLVTDRCGPPPVLASFFTGGLVDGTPCERDAQCSGGLCTLDTRVCAPAVAVLCPAP